MEEESGWRVSTIQENVEKHIRWYLQLFSVYQKKVQSKMKKLNKKMEMDKMYIGWCNYLVFSRRKFNQRWWSWIGRDKWIKRLYMYIYEETELKEEART